MAHVYEVSATCSQAATDLKWHIELDDADQMLHYQIYANDLIAAVFVKLSEVILDHQSNMSSAKAEVHNVIDQIRSA
jgi:hypothetical protein